MKRTSASVAAVLSFIMPGLGHWYLGRRRAAAVLALPALIVLMAMGLEALSGVDRVLAYAITPAGAFTITALLVLTGVWRAIAIVDAVIVARRLGSPRLTLGIAVGAVALGLVLGMHGWSSYLAYNVYSASSQIFVGENPDGANPTATAGSGASGGAADSVAPSDSGQANEFQATPNTTPATASSRINVLITGIDSARGRTEALNDTLMVISVNPVDNSVIMLSMPRDVSNFPLYNGGGIYHGKINSLMTYALLHPAQFPDGPLPTLMKELGYLIGVPIHYYAALNIEAFSQLIDLVGGVTVTNPAPINDPTYDWLDGSPLGLTMPAGPVNLNGRMALAFVRSRKGIGDNDYTRANRQQLLLLALRDKLTSPSMLPKLPQIVQVAAQTVRTDLPADQMATFITLARHMDPSKVQQFVLGPPFATHPDMSLTNGIWILELNMPKLKRLSTDLFGSDSAYYTGG